jgi:flagellar protein FlaF
MSIERYKSTQTTTENPRQTEYRLFALVTRSLIEAKERGGRGRKFIEAVDWNRRLWLTLQMDLASDGNGLTDQLRAQLISVAIWVDKHSSAALRGEAEIEPLISVNRTIMEGLAVRPGAPEQAASARPAFAAGGTSA